MIICYDTEFVDDGRTVELLSIGMVAENGDELYRIVEDADWDCVATHDWMVNNVVVRLPIRALDWNGATWDSGHPDAQYVMSRRQVAQDVEDFLWKHADGPDGPLADLWADYPATDHVALYQLFGPMVECTRHGMAMRTSCLTQEERSWERLAARVSVPVVRQRVRVLTKPRQDPATTHHALHDARHDMDLAHWLGLTS